MRMSNVHVESFATLLLVRNPLALASPRSNASTFTFVNCGGYVPSTGPRLIDTTGDNTYAGKLIFDAGCDWYGDITAGGVSIDRALDHIVLGTNTRIDIDGTPFGQSFKQGLSGISTTFRGKPRLRGETILSRNAAVTSIASAGGTIVQFPGSSNTPDNGYGDATYAAGVWTADQNLKDIEIDYQLAFATAVPIADTWITVNGVDISAYGAKCSDLVRLGSTVIPVLSKGDIVSIRAATNTGAAVLLSGGNANYLRIRAKTQ